MDNDTNIKTGQTPEITKLMHLNTEKTGLKPLPSMKAGWLVARRLLMFTIAVFTVRWMFMNGHIITGILWVLGTIVLFFMIFGPTEVTKEGTKWNRDKSDNTTPYNEEQNGDIDLILNSKSVPNDYNLVPTFGLLDMSEPRFDVSIVHRPLTLDEIAMRAPAILYNVVKPAAEDTRSLEEIGHLKNVYGRPAGSLQETGKFTASRVKTGTAGELETARILALFAERHPDVAVLHDLKLPAIPRKEKYVRQVRPDPDNHANIDHVVVIGNTIIPIDSKNYKVVDYGNSGRGNTEDVKALRRQKLDYDRVVSNIKDSKTFEMISNRLKRNFYDHNVMPPFIVMDGYGFEIPLCTMQTFRWPGGAVMTEGELLANLEFIYSVQEAGRPANNYVVASLLGLMN